MIGPDLDAILASGPAAAAHYDRACRSFADAERRRALEEAEPPTQGETP